MLYSPVLFSKNMCVFPQTGAATSHLKYTVLTWAFKPPAEFRWEPTEKSRQVEFSAAHFFRTCLWILEVPVSIQTSAQLSAGLTKHRDHPTYSWVLHLIPRYIRSRASGNGRWCREWRATPQCHRSNSGKRMEGTERNSVCKPIPCFHKRALTTKSLIWQSPITESAQHWIFLSSISSPHEERHRFDLKFLFQSYIWHLVEIHK